MGSLSEEVMVMVSAYLRLKTIAKDSVKCQSQAPHHFVLLMHIDPS